MKKRIVLILLMIVGCALQMSGSVEAQDVEVPLGYSVSYIQLSSTDPEGAALAIAPDNEQLLYASVGGWGPHKVVRVDLSQNPPVVEDFATGAYNLSGPETEDDALDSWFGTVGGLAVLHTGEVIIVDNNEQPSVPGDTIYIARDLNGDGDAQDIITQPDATTVSEVIELIKPIHTLPGSGWGGFTGQQAEVDSQDNIYIVTADGGGQGEVLRITDAVSSPGINIWYEGLDYGAGLGFDSAGKLIVGNSSWPTGASIYITEDLSEPRDGDALDAGESVLLTDAITGIYDLALSAEDVIYITNGRYVQRVERDSGRITNFATFPQWTFLGDIVFTSRTKPFVPTPGEDSASMIIADGNSDGMLTVISPAPSTKVAPTRWTYYE
ncbi:hypothetical protein J7M23_08985 [Candidatus Sumerlaeota bacterium]|nr:hypothetical protein [Candidatus Sumerlaeota bacterium]